MDQEKQDEKQGFYSAAYTLEEVAALVSQEMDETIEDELTAVRIAIRRVMEEMKEELETAEFAKMVGLIFRGTNSVAQLLRTQRAVSGMAADGMLGAVAQILQELETEQDWQV
ncbi:MAG: hypothetical protein WAM60_11595 [Candidatus Promineifilaceae bacterium]